MNIIQIFGILCTTTYVIYSRPDIYFRNAKDIKASPFLPPMTPFSLLHPSSHLDGEEEKTFNRSSKIDGQTRKERMFSPFTIIRFKNTLCTPTLTTSLNGTCYLADECTERGGQTGGVCAGGFGVCCTFNRGCGTTSAVNQTFWSTQSESPCTLTICKCQSDICFLRLELTTLVLTQPDNTVAPAGTTATQCLNDRFTITAPGFSTPPVICGTNSGMHIYVPASDACNQLAITKSTTTFTRSWDIRIDQIECSSPSKPPDTNCLQYYTGVTGTVQSLNFAGSRHLANQDYAICVRPESGYCSLTWTSISFAVSGTIANDMKSGEADCTTDYLYFPDFGRFCATSVPASLQTSVRPYMLYFVTNNMEQTNGVGLTGFSLTYTQTAC